MATRAAPDRLDCKWAMELCANILRSVEKRNRLAECRFEDGSKGKNQG
jgi:hypothetical protein